MTERVAVYKPYLGSGKVWLRDQSLPNGPSYHIGNVSELKLTHDETVIEQKDHTSSGGGTHAEVRRINSVTAAITMHDLNADNLALATKGTNTTVAAGTITDEAGTAHKGALIRLAKPSPTTVVVTSSDGNTTYTEGTDYDIAGAGIVIATTGALADEIDALGTPSDGVPVLIDYAYGAYNELEALTQGNANWALTFDGVNEADGDSPQIVDLHKVNLGAASELSLIGDALGTISVEGKCLKDSSQGAGKSAYYRVQQA